MIASLFLVPNDTFFVELAVVLVLVFLFYKYILPPLNRVLSERQEQIRGSIEAAERAKKDAEAADDERQHVLDEARGQAREIVASAQLSTNASSRPRPSRCRRPASAPSRKQRRSSGRS